MRVSTTGGTASRTALRIASSRYGFSTTEDSPGRPRPIDQVALAIPGDRDERDVPLGADLLRGLDPVEMRQREVEQDEIRAMLAGEPNGLLPIAGIAADVVARLFEHEPELGADDRVVFGRQTH